MNKNVILSKRKRVEGSTYVRYAVGSNQGEDPSTTRFAIRFPGGGLKASRPTVMRVI